MPVRFETFAYLPPFSPQQAEAQVEYLLSKGCIPQIEYHENPTTADFFWDIWPLPHSRVDTETGRVKISAAQVAAQIEACARRNPFAYVAVAGYHPGTRQTLLRFVARGPQEGA